MAGRWRIRRWGWGVVAMLACIAGSSAAWPQAVPPRPETAAAARGQAARSIRETYLAAARSEGPANLPIGVFDSGTGGLAVLEQILRLDRFDNATRSPRPGGDGRPDFEAERFLFLADQANMPYGNYPAAGRGAFLVDLILHDVAFLLGNQYSRHARTAELCRDKLPAKHIVIACNTATAHGKRHIAALLDLAEIDVRVVDVIEAGAHSAVEAIGGKRATIGVLATKGTADSGAYPAAIEALARQQGIGPLTVVQQGSVGLAGAIDGVREFLLPGARGPRPDYRGPSLDHPAARIDAAILPRYAFDFAEGHMLWQGDQARPAVLQINSVGNYVAYEVVSLLEAVRGQSPPDPLAAVVLGCTHFPYYAGAFRRELQRLYDYQEGGQYVYRRLMAPEVRCLDPAVMTARQLYLRLSADGKLRAPRSHQENNNNKVRGEFYVTVPNPDWPGVELDSGGGFTYTYKYGRSSGGLEARDVRVVPLTTRFFDAATARRLEQQLPAVWRLLSDFTACSSQAPPGNSREGCWTPKTGPADKAE